ncbi:MAG: hypothetical protein GYB64_01370 [Chloroflexi bacterium]|nr:hypothetical protein [Chloroflexota bacterium]
MAKRKNRLGPIDHEVRQLENLKGLEPIKTPAEYLDLSNALIDLCLLALEEVRSLEAGDPANQERLDTLAQRANALKDL